MIRGTNLKRALIMKATIKGGIHLLRARICYKGKSNYSGNYYGKEWFWNFLLNILLLPRWERFIAWKTFPSGTLNDFKFTPVTVDPLQQVFQTFFFIFVSFNKLFVPGTKVEVYIMRRAKISQLSLVVVKTSIIVEREATDFNRLSIERKSSTKSFDRWDSKAFLCFWAILSSFLWYENFWFIWSTLHIYLFKFSKCVVRLVSSPI